MSEIYQRIGSPAPKSAGVLGIDLYGTKSLFQFACAVDRLDLHFRPPAYLCIYAYILYY